MENLKDKAVKSIFWVGVSRFGGQMISWSVTILLIRILSPYDYGLMGMALAYKQFIIIFFDLSIGEAVLQKKDLSETDIYTAVWVCVTFAIILYIATWFMAVAWARFFSNNELIPIVRFLGISLIVLSINEIPNRLLAKEFEFKKRSFFQVSASMLCLMTSLILALMGHGVWSLVIGEVVRDVSLTSFILVYLKWVPKFKFSFDSAAQLLRYGLPVTGFYIFNYISSKSDSIIIGRLLGQTVLGYYTVALSVSKIPVQRGIQIIQQVLFPLFSEIQDDTDACGWYFYKIIYIISVFFFPVFMGMFSVSEEIIVLILSPKWLPALWTFKLLCIVGLMMSFTGIFMVILKSRGKTGKVFQYSILTALLFPITHYISSQFGLTAVAVGWIVVYPVLFSYLIYHVAKEIEVSLFKTLKIILHPMIASLLMISGVVFIKTMEGDVINFLTLAANVLTGATIYLGYFYLFSRQTFTDVKTIWRTLKS